MDEVNKHITREANRKFLGLPQLVASGNVNLTTITARLEVLYALMPDFFEPTREPLS